MPSMPAAMKSAARCGIVDRIDPGLLAELVDQVDLRRGRSSRGSRRSGRRRSRRRPGSARHWPVLPLSVQSASRRRQLAALGDEFPVERLHDDLVGQLLLFQQLDERGRVARLALDQRRRAGLDQVERLGPASAASSRRICRRTSGPRRASGNLRQRQVRRPAACPCRATASAFGRAVEDFVVNHDRHAVGRMEDSPARPGRPWRRAPTETPAACSPARRCCCRGGR